MSYLHHATHNFDTLQKRGGVCVCCMQGVAFRDITEWIRERTGLLTAQCPHCSIDAVAPRGKASDEAVRAWHREGFQQYITVDGY